MPVHRKLNTLGDSRRLLVILVACGLSASACGAGLEDGSRTKDGAQSSRTASSAASTSLPGVDWASMAYPISCGGATTGSVGGSANPEPSVNLTIVFVSCVAGAGSPPSAVLIYDNVGPGGNPHLRQQLLSYQDDWLPVPKGLTATAGNLAMPMVRTDGAPPDLSHMRRAVP